MSTPCVRYECVSSAALRRYDYFRWLVIGFFLALLIVFLMIRGCQQERERLSLSTHRLVNVAVAGAVGRVAGVLQVNGTGQRGATVEFKYEDELVATAKVAANGLWALDQRIELPPGWHIVHYRMMSEDGSLLDEAEPFEFVVPEMARPKLAVNTPEVGDFTLGSGAGLVAGILKLTGTGLPGASVEIEQKGESVATTAVDADGRWGLDQRIELPPGHYDFRVRMVDRNGNLWDETEPFELNFPEVKVAGLKLAAPQLEKPALVNLHDAVAGRLVLSGQGQSGLVIRFLRDGEPIGDTIVDANGNWNFEKDLVWKMGTFQLTAHMLAINGSVLDEVVMTLDSVALSGDNFLQPLSGGSGGQPNRRGVETGRPVVEVILDASGSMWAKFGKKHRFQTARELLVNLINDVLPAGTPVALRAFGNMEGNYSCRSDLMVPLKPLERKKMREIINAIVPKKLAGSAIADSLSHVTEDLAEADGPKIVILITDGNESCDGNPASAIEALVEQDDNLRVDIVGIAIENSALKTEYERWATLGHGRYYDATSSQALTETLAEALIIP